MRGCAERVGAEGVAVAKILTDNATGHHHRPLAWATTWTVNVVRQTGRSRGPMSVLLTWAAKWAASVGRYKDR